MSGKFRNKYRIGSKRLKGYDYSLPGKYFITICTLNRVNYFGTIDLLSELGHITEQEWLKTPGIRPDMNLTLDEFIIMPDHFHAILIIGENGNNGSRNVMHHVSTKTHHVSTKTHHVSTKTHHVSTKTHHVSTKTHHVSTKTHHVSTKTHHVSTFEPPQKNLGSIIRGFKSAVTTYARKNNIDFAWQPRYYDHIIRNDAELIRIRKYIKNNRVKL